MNLYTETFVRSAADLGYWVFGILHYQNGDALILIEPMKDRAFTPGIYPEKDPDGRLCDWFVQSPSYEALREEELSQMLEGYERARRMLGMLRSVDQEGLSPYVAPEVSESA